MDDDIIRMAQEAQQERLSLDGRSVPSTALSGHWFPMEAADLARFAALVRADEREACISIIEGYRIPVGNSAAGEMACEWTYDALRAIRAAIRARAQQPDPQVADRLARHGIPMPGDPK